MGAGPVATFVKPDSVLARTAREVVDAHAGGAGPRAGLTACPVCGEPLPCSTGRAAAEVLFAAGLAESSGLIDAARGGRGAPGPLELPADRLPVASAYAATGPSTAPLVPDLLSAGSSTSDAAVSSASTPGELPFSGPGVAAGSAGSTPSADGLAGVTPAAWGSADVPPRAPDPLTGPVPASGYGRPDLVAEQSGLTLAEPVEPGVHLGPSGPGPLDVGLDAAPPARSEPPAPSAWSEPPAPPVDVDPLLLGPPVFTQQNRPLDAPQYTHTARISGVDAPLAGPTSPAQFSGLSGVGEAPSLEPVRSDRLGDLPPSAPTHQPGKPRFGSPQSEPVEGGMPSGLGGPAAQPASAAPAAAASASGLPGHAGPGPAAPDTSPFRSGQVGRPVAGRPAPGPSHAAGPTPAHPIPADPSHAGSSPTDPSHAGSSPADPSHAGSSYAGSSYAGSSHAGPGNAGPAQGGPGNAGPGQAGSGNAGPGQAGPGQAGPGHASQQNKSPFLSRPAGQANQGPAHGWSEEQNAPRGQQPAPVNPQNPFPAKPDPQPSSQPDGPFLARPERAQAAEPQPSPSAAAPAPLEQSAGQSPFVARPASLEQSAGQSAFVARPGQPGVPTGQSPFLARPEPQPEGPFIPPAGPYASRADDARPPQETPVATAVAAAQGGPGAAADDAVSGPLEAAPAMPTWPPTPPGADDDAPSGLPPRDAG
ncbi:MAG: hypothetical protein QOH97_812 [Actinoplanes sp.]|nr:hypothetical protein [Actinoplanes sp.]